MIIKYLYKQFSRYGVPSTLRTNNGANLVSAEMEEYFNEIGIEHRLTTPLWTRTNGEFERQNRFLLKAMRVAHAEKRDWRSELNKFLLAYRSTPHITTGKSPAKLLFRRKMSKNCQKLLTWRNLRTRDISKPEIKMQRKSKLVQVMLTRRARQQRNT